MKVKIFVQSQNPIKTSNFKIIKTEQEKVDDKIKEFKDQIKK